MEDLGTINIKIEETSAGGGGGGGGTMGQGPAKTALDATRGAQGGFRQIIDFLRRWDAKGIATEALDFVKRPSVSGFQQLLSTSTSTGTAARALAALGVAGGIAAGAFLAVVAAAGAAVVAFRVFRYAAQVTAERIEAVGKFSGPASIALANERLAEFSRQLYEAQKNGRLYAEAQFWATGVQTQINMIQVEYRAMLAELAVAFQKVSYWALLLTRPLISFVLNLDRLQKFLEKAVFGYLSFTNPIVGMYLQQIYDLIKQALFVLNIIARPASPAGGVNAWMMADVQAITGKSYSVAGKGIMNAR